MIIRMEHIRAAGFCSRGGREFFKRHGLNWQEFLEHGIEEEAILKTGDHYGTRVVEVARRDG